MLVHHESDLDFAARRVLVVGVGGLGSSAALALAHAEVGTLGLMDPDPVEVSNLHRQLLYDSADVGRPKVTVAAEQLRRLMPGLHVESRRERFGPHQAAVLRGFDCVVDGTDTVAAKFALSDAAVAARVPLVHAGVLGFVAQLMTVVPGESACYRCVFEEPPPPDEVPSCQEAGVLGPVVALAGALQAAEAIRLLGWGAPAWANRLLRIDAWTGRWRTVPLAPNPRCAACAALSPLAAPTANAGRSEGP
ncbi:MAG: HesA/MoeB/ThiF family protein [Deltaproteobacteria bacterium]|nr:MAG: HesA/MoeB/ThiF family protein [Deltaproteobacteria bacterium]TMB42338.1 MAG: HesA/MoeB/ThiF family protein [Deltaproteobacteria bacterium]